MTKKLVFIFWTVLLSGISFGQSDRLFASMEEALAVHPDSVYRLDLSHQQLKEVPAELLQFQNLRELDLSKNKLASLPPNFIFPRLEVLNLTKNKFETFPEAICKNTTLTQLFMGKNKMNTVPECIGDLEELAVLDIWFNYITDLPETLVNLKNLRSFDLRGMNYSEAFQRKWIALLPWAEIQFDAGCDCGY